MWNLTSTDVQKAKERLELRRAEIETRYAEEKNSLDAEMIGIEGFERAASEFALAYAQGEEAAAEPPMDPPVDPEPAAAAVEPEIADEPAPGAETGGDRDILKPGSRWRLYRPNDATTPGAG